MEDALEGDGGAHWPAARIEHRAKHNKMKAAKTPALPLWPNRMRILRIQCNAKRKQAVLAELAEFAEP
jgi:hypothetical protein